MGQGIHSKESSEFPGETKRLDSSFRALNPADLARIQYSIALIASEMRLSVRSTPSNRISSTGRAYTVDDGDDDGDDGVDAQKVRRSGEQKAELQIMGNPQLENHDLSVQCPEAFLPGLLE